jgi:hypothetical protein
MSQSLRAIFHPANIAALLATALPLSGGNVDVTYSEEPDAVFEDDEAAMPADASGSLYLQGHSSYRLRNRWRYKKSRPRSHVPSRRMRGRR